MKKKTISTATIKSILYIDALNVVVPLFWSSFLCLIILIIMNGTIAIIDAEVLLNVFQYKVWILFFSKLFAKKKPSRCVRMVSLLKY